MINFIYVVRYIVNTSVFNSFVYEEYIFTDFKQSHRKMLEIVKEEERDSGKEDFYNFHIEIEKKAIDVTNPWTHDEEIWYFDMIGKQIYKINKHILEENKKKIYKNNTVKFYVGDIVKISPFPWNKYTSIPIEVNGVISNIQSQDKNEYIVYIFDKAACKFFHSHESGKAMSIVNDIKNLDINLKILSKFFKDEIQIKYESFEESLSNGTILATTKERLIDLV